MTDLEQFKDMLDRANIRYEEYTDFEWPTRVVKIENFPFVVKNHFREDGSLKNIVSYVERGDR
jgi:hypothetical protein